MRVLLTIGVLMVLVGIAFVVLGASNQGNVSTGGVIFIGPFPIVFGSGLGGGELALISVVIGGVMFVLFLLWSWRLSHPSKPESQETIK